MSTALETDREWPRSTRILAIMGALAVLALKLWYARTLSVDSDEPQHLHVVWAWTQGLLPYRDVFDNHAPLFQVCMAPLLALVGERGDVVFWMRLPMIGLWLLTVYVVWRMADDLFDRQVAWASVPIVVLSKTLFVHSLQFRTDNLWALFWIASLGLLSRPRPLKRNIALAGLLAGAALAVSMKTIVLLAALSISALICSVGRSWSKARSYAVFANAARYLAGLLLIPLLATAYFLCEGIGPAFYQGLIGHNLVPGLHEETEWQRVVLAAGLLLSAIAYARRPRRDAGDARLQFHRQWLGLQVVLGWIAFRLLWPSFTAQDLLPVLPPLLVFGTAELFALLRARRRDSWAPLAVALLAMALGAELLVGDPPWRNLAAADRELRSTVLQLVPPGGYVMDAKGETVFRQRSIYPVLESLTLKRYELGLLENDIPERLAATATAVVIPARVAIDARTGAFLRRNYLQLAPDLLVAGQEIAVPEQGGSVEFEIEVPTRYAVRAAVGRAPRIDRSGPVAEVQLTAGPHRLHVNAGAGRVELVYAPALGLRVAGTVVK